MNKVNKISIKQVMKDARLTPALLLERINNTAYKQLLNNIKGRNYSTKQRKEYIDTHIKEYQMSRATLYNILNNNKASDRKVILIKETLEEIIKEKKLYDNAIIEIDIQEYESR